MEDILCSIDLGSSQVRMMAAKPSQKQAFEVLSFQSINNDGMQAGLISDIEKTTRAISECKKKVEREIGCVIDSASVSITSDSIITYQSKGIAAILQKQVSLEDIKNALDLARVYLIPNNYELLHCIVQRYLVDGKGVNYPLEIHGVRLELDCLLVAIDKQILDNVVYCLKQCKIDLDDAIVSPYASAISTLSEDDRHHGVIMLDIGDSLTDIVIYKNLALTHVDSIAFAGGNITKTIANYFHTSLQEIEKLKNKYVCVDIEQIDNFDEEISIYSVRENKDYPYTIGEFNQIVADYYDQSLKQIKDYISKDLGVNDFENYGIVLTGGSSLTPGINELAKNVFEGSATRVGLTNLDPKYFSKRSIHPAQLANLAGVMIHNNLEYFKENERFALTELTNRKSVKKSGLWSWLNANKW